MFIKYLKTIFDRGVTQRFFNRKSRNNIENYLIKYLPSKNLCLVDVGAHEGLFTKLISQFCEIKCAILIEPISEKAQLLKNKLTKEKYMVFNKLISNSDNNKYPFYINKYTETSSILKINENLPELANVDTNLESVKLIESATLDSIYKQANLKYVDLLKIDVQGAELLALQGAEKALSLTKRIWIEVSFIPLYKESAVFSDIYLFLKNKGFMMIEIFPGHRSPDNELLQADILFENQSL